MLRRSSRYSRRANRHTGVCFSGEQCAHIIKLCEEEKDCAWSARGDYAQSTVDMEVDKLPKLCRYLRSPEVSLPSKLTSIYKSVYHASIASLDDVFVVRYSAASDKEGIKNGQTGLRSHVDAGDVSFMVALSEWSEYSGGGTFFHKEGEAWRQEDEETGDVKDAEGVTIHLNRGEVITFPASL